MAQELWQSYELNGQPGRSITKEEARSGVLHGASHVWIWRRAEDGNKVLLQRRASDKPTWPGFLDISAAGHIDAGETPLEAATRETQEEIGLTLGNDSLELLFVRHADDLLDSGIRENEFVWVYLHELKGDIAISQDNDEVDSVSWVSVDQLVRLVAGKDPASSIVPHIYFDDLLQRLKSLD